MKATSAKQLKLAIFLSEYVVFSVFQIDSFAFSGLPYEGKASGSDVRPLKLYGELRRAVPSGD